MNQSGLTVAITSPIISAIQTAQQMSEAAKDTKDSRMQLLAAANVGLSAYSTYDAIDKGQGATTTIDGITKDNQIVTKTDAAGNALGGQFLINASSTSSTQEAPGCTRCSQ